MTTSTSNSQALAFYQANLQNVTNYGLGFLTERSERQLYNAGKVIVSTVKVQPKSAQPKKARKATKNVRWSGAELDLLINLYLKYVDPLNGIENGATIIVEFTQEFPNRTSGAIILGLAQVKALDVYHPASGLTDTSQALIDKLYAIDPIRFPGGATKEDKIMNALDNLIADIRR